MARIYKLNLVGVVLPFCLLEFKNALARLAHGQMLEVLIQDPAVVEDLIRLVDRSEDRLVRQKKAGRIFHIVVERTGKPKRSFKEEA